GGRDRRVRRRPLAAAGAGPARGRGLGGRAVGGLQEHDHPVRRAGRNAGPVATAFGDTASVVSGGLACVVGAFAVARALPGFTGLRWGLPQHTEDEAAGGENTEGAQDAGKAE